jgi:hypothetical protein
MVVVAVNVYNQLVNIGWEIRCLNVATELVKRVLAC